MDVNKTIEALMVLIPPPIDGESNHGFSIRADEKTLRELSESDNPFAGYLLSCMCDTKEQAEAVYNDWVDKKITKSKNSFSGTVG